MKSPTPLISFDFLEVFAVLESGDKWLKMLEANGRKIFCEYYFNKTKKQMCARNANSKRNSLKTNSYFNILFEEPAFCEWKRYCLQFPLNLVKFLVTQIELTLKCISKKAKKKQRSPVINLRCSLPQKQFL